jgi:RimJ/RimL family protein N-acetyltransferase
MAILPAVRVDRQGRPFLVREMVAADRPALQAMYEAFEPKRAAQGLPPGDPESIARWLERVIPEGLHLVIEVEGLIRGHAMLLRIDQDRAELANFLHQDVRYRGIGTHVNRLILELAREAKYRRVWLCVEPGNRPAVRSYERAGFRMKPGEIWAPEVEMEVVLEPPMPSAPPADAPGAAPPIRR